MTSNIKYDPLHHLKTFPKIKLGLAIGICNHNMKYVNLKSKLPLDSQKIYQRAINMKSRSRFPDVFGYLK